MRSLYYTGLCLFFFFHVAAQEKQTPAGHAKVDVFVTDMQGKPAAGEKVVFAAEKSRWSYSGRSGADGKFDLQLPAGDKYIISVMSLNDTTKYGLIDIPLLEADQYYTESFKVNVKFALARTFTLRNLHFDVNKATLRADSFDELNELVLYLKSRQDISIEIGGHTDNVGQPESNLRLSSQRAETIRRYLIGKGIAASRVMAKGYGAAMPVADNSLPEGRQLNRRTEVRIL